MFPISMAAQHRHLAGALAKVVSQSDNVDDLTTFLEGLGRDHRKFGVVAEHYDAGGSRACWRPWNISRGRPGRAERLLPGPAFPRYPTVEVRVADVCPDAGTAALAAAAAGARRGRSRPVHRAGRRCAGPPLPPARSCLPRAHRARRHRDDHQAAAPARPAEDRSRPPASPVHQRRIHARVHHRTRPRNAVRLRTGAAPAADGPGRARRQCDGGAREPGRQAGGGCRGAAAGTRPASRAGRRSGPRRCG